MNSAPMTEADKLRATARLVLRRQWDGRHFAGAVRAWERERGGMPRPRFTSWRC
jgi:hypothetical protein